MMIELTEAETRELYSTTLHQTKQLLTQIVHTDHRAFKTTLKDRHTRLDQIRAKLEAALPGVQRSDVA